jgi:polysaccharide pyruvyl transferase WcaK-like protein
MKAALINAVPANCGDELLLLASIRLLEAAGFTVGSVHSNQRNYFDVVADKPHFWDMEHALYQDIRSLPYPVRKLPQFARNGAWSVLSRLPVTNSYKTNAQLQQAGWIFSSAGGYMNSRYGYGSRLRVLEAMLAADKKVVLLPQSIGPFHAHVDHGRLRDVLEQARLVMVRDRISLDHLDGIGLSMQNVGLWPDLGLISGLLPFYDERPLSYNDTPRVLFNARAWTYRSSGSELVAKLGKLLSELVEGGKSRVICASTCQGINGYVDDAEIMQQLANFVPEHDRHYISFVSEHLHPLDYHKLARTCDCYIGMRMHGAIIAMHAGIPALAIAYEEKSGEVFKQLGIPECCIDMDDSASSLSSKASWFLSNLQSLRSRTNAALAKEDLDFSVILDRFVRSLGL